jgi:hypothetical protein
MPRLIEKLLFFPCGSVFSVVNSCFPASAGSTSSRRREHIHFQQIRYSGQKPSSMIRSISHGQVSGKASSSIPVSRSATARDL